MTSNKSKSVSKHVSSIPKSVETKPEIEKYQPKEYINLLNKKRNQYTCRIKLFEDEPVVKCKSFSKTYSSFSSSEKQKRVYKAQTTAQR